MKLAALALAAGALYGQGAISITDAPYSAKAGVASAALCEANTRAINAAVGAAAKQGTALVTIPAGVFPTHTVKLYNADGTRSGMTITGPGTLQSCGAETLVEATGTHFGLRMRDLNLDCKGVGTDGLVFGPATADNAVSGVQILNCQKRGLLLDGTQNSHFSDLAFYGDTLPIELTGGAGEILFSRTEVQLAAGSRNGILISGANTVVFEMAQVECNGAKSCTAAPGPVAVNIAKGSSITIRDSILDGGPIGGPELIYVNGTGNLFENNFYNTSGFDEKTFVNATGFAESADFPNVARGGMVYFGGACKEPFLTSGGMFVVDKVMYGLAAQRCMKFVDTSGKGLAQTVNFIPRSHSGAWFAGFTPPAGTVGSFYFDGANGPVWWNGDRYVDASGNAAGQCREANGEGSPNGRVAGNPCDRYRNTKADGKTPAMWTKESGAGTNTGWRGAANGYVVSCDAGGEHALEAGWGTVASCVLDVKGIWEITASAVGLQCGAPAVCGARLSVGSAANEVESSQREVVGLSVDALFATVEAAPAQVVLEMRKGVLAGASSVGVVRIRARLLAGL